MKPKKQFGLPCLLGQDATLLKLLLRRVFGESMFSRERDASKAALAHLVDYCRSQGIVVIDCQLPSRHLQSMGSRLISRGQFQGLLREHIAMGAVFVQYPRPNV